MKNLGQKGYLIYPILIFLFVYKNMVPRDSSLIKDSRLLEDQRTMILGIFKDRGRKGLIEIFHLFLHINSLLREFFYNGRLGTIEH